MGLLDNLEEQDYAPGWKPEPGEGVEGVVEGNSSRTTEYGDYPIVTIVTDAGERVAIHASRTVIKDKVFELQPQIGDRFAVRYVGLVAGKKPGAPSYHSYLAGVERGTGAPAPAPKAAEETAAKMVADAFPDPNEKF